MLSFFCEIYIDIFVYSDFLYLKSNIRNPLIVTDFNVITLLQIMILLLSLIIAFARNPIGLVAIILMCFSILILNNKFAEFAGAEIAKVAKKVSPQMAVKVSTYLNFG